MLKFQKDYTTTLATFEDLIITTYVIIDDLYQHIAPPEISGRRNVQQARLSDPELITISVCGELAGVDSENAWYSFVKRNYRRLFPKLCSRSRLNRTRRNRQKTTELLWQELVNAFPVPKGRYFVVDSFPLSVCKFGRARYCRAFRGQGADYGRCPSKKETYFGYKVHALITLGGYITSFGVTPASVDNRDGLRDLAGGLGDAVVLADKGYVGETFREEMQGQGICLVALKRSNSRADWSRPVRQRIFRQRRRGETVFSQLNAERVLAKSVRGLHTRLLSKILAYDFCLALSSICHETCDFAKIKQLVF